MSLDKVGDVARELGQLEQARSAYQESLDIGRQLLQRTGDAPQSLRDLSVSLSNVGNVAWELGQMEQARSAYQEALAIVQRLQRVLSSDRSLETAERNLRLALQQLDMHLPDPSA